MNIYTQEFLHYYKNQPFKKKLKESTVTGREVNSSCGDDLSVQIKISENNIKDIGYTGEGCAVSEGAMSILSEELIGQDIDTIKNLTEKDVLSKLGFELTTSRQKCALIGFLALKNAYNNYINNNESKQN